MDLLAIAAAASQTGIRPGAEAEAGLTINFFWVIVSALNFLVFLALIWAFGFRRIAAMLDERRARIEQGLRDAEQARRDREQAAAERLAAIQEARKEAAEIINRAQRAAQEAREADIAATRARTAAGRGAGRDRGRETAGDRRPPNRGGRARPRGGGEGRRRDDDRRPPPPDRRGVSRRDGDARTKRHRSGQLRKHDATPADDRVPSLRGSRL